MSKLRHVRVPSKMELEQKLHQEFLDKHWQLRTSAANAFGVKITAHIVRTK